MGFIVNYVEEHRSDNGFTLLADTVDAMPDGFEDSQWKLKLTKSSDDQFTLSLYMGKNDEFSLFWEAQYNRI
jgi:hypothetical protein